MNFMYVMYPIIIFLQRYTNTECLKRIAPIMQKYQVNRETFYGTILSFIV